VNFFFIKRAGRESQGENAARGSGEPVVTEKKRPLDWGLNQGREIGEQARRPSWKLTESYIKNPPGEAWGGVLKGNGGRGDTRPIPAHPITLATAFGANRIPVGDAASGSRTKIGRLISFLR